MKKRLSRTEVLGARLKQRQERCSKGAVKLREVKERKRRVASASLVAKKATSRRSALCAGTCPRRSSETGWNSLPFASYKGKGKSGGKR